MTSSLWYTLDVSGKPISCRDMCEWSCWIESADRSVAMDDFGILGRISTVFLGLDHSFGFGLAGKPVLWETMIFGGARDGDQWRYTSVASAKRKHNRLVREFRKIQQEEQQKIQQEEQQKIQQQEYYRKTSMPVMAKSGRRIERI